MTKYYLHRIHEGLINRNLPIEFRKTWFKFLTGYPTHDFDLLVTLTAIINILENRHLKPKEHIEYQYNTAQEIISILLKKKYIFDHDQKKKS